MQNVYNKVCPLSCNKRAHTHDFESVLTLQNCMAVLRDECGSRTDTCQTSSGDGNQFLFVNAEDFMDIEVEEDPKPSTSAVIKPEPVVSFVSVYPVLITVDKYPELPVSVCQSIHRVICMLVSVV